MGQKIQLKTKDGSRRYNTLASHLQNEKEEHGTGERGDRLRTEIVSEKGGNGKRGESNQHGLAK